MKEIVTPIEDRMIMFTVNGMNVIVEFNLNVLMLL